MKGIDDDSPQEKVKAVNPAPPLKKSVFKEDSSLERGERTRPDDTHEDEEDESTLRDKSME